MKRAGTGLGTSADGVMSVCFSQAAKKAALKGTNATALKKVRTSATFHRCVLFHLVLPYLGRPRRLRGRRLDEAARKGAWCERNL